MKINSKVIAKHSEPDWILHCTAFFHSVKRIILELFVWINIYVFFWFYFFPLNIHLQSIKLFTINSPELKAILFIIKINILSRCAYTIKRFLFLRRESFSTTNGAFFSTSECGIKIKITFVSPARLYHKKFFPSTFTQSSRVPAAKQ